ncbi:hypothetical protein [Acanthopleuribacter pedis]|uniref:Uncharacterized protein n=1 Tax=Acanthopleuribacter pedis TaxID=442870 RepID=A0A8J7Q4Z3_9BACT|nr:hypothetical protein [Acanthopleuribacter pedis]MBO1318207.1 hypothetical protein [Acanthopleuribacter pedis]
MTKSLSDCPACHGQIDEQHQCGRCGADLSYLHTLTHEMERLEAAATHAVAAKRFEVARTFLAEAAQYERTPYNVALAAWIPVLEAETAHEAAEAEAEQVQAEKPSRLDSVKQFFSRFTRGKDGS